jgi:hypothetical protein
MEPVVKEDLLAILSQTIGILKTKETSDYIALSELSNHTVHDASIYQDEDSISIAIAVYALAKIVQRCAETNIHYPQFVPLLESAKKALDADNHMGYDAAIKSLFTMISSVDKRIKLYVQEVLDKARLKKGSKIAEHGLSIARAADLMGLSRWELMDYVGKTTVESPEGLDVVQRFRIARQLFS